MNLKLTQIKGATKGSGYGWGTSPGNIFTYNQKLDIQGEPHLVMLFTPNPDPTKTVEGLNDKFSLVLDHYPPEGKPHLTQYNLDHGDPLFLIRIAQVLVKDPLVSDELLDWLGFEKTYY